MVYSYRVNNGFIRVFNYAANGNMLSPIYSSVTKHFISSLYEKETTRYGTRHLNYIYGETGIVAILVKTSTSTTDLGTMYYVHTDHLGSYNLIMDADKNIVDSLHFDPWGNRKRYNNWASNDTRVSFLFDRGFTGHEHLDRFKIINMKVPSKRGQSQACLLCRAGGTWAKPTYGRLYDPVLTRFFSPDPYVQLPDFTQNFNRYSYCLNNPLMFTDPSGEFFGLLVRGMHFLSTGLENVLNGVDDPWGNASQQASGFIAGVSNCWQIPIGDNASIGLDMFGFGLSFNVFHNQDGQTFGMSAGWGFMSGWFVRSYFSQQIGDWDFGFGVGGGTNHAGWYGTGSYKGWGLSYGQTYYGNAIGPDEVPNPQRTGTISFFSPNSTFRMENDIWGDKFDRWRSSAIEASFGPLIIGTNVYTNAPREESTDNYISRIWKKKERMAYSNGKVYSSPFYIGIRDGSKVTRIGINHPGIQDLIQNGWHILITSPLFPTPYGEYSSLYYYSGCYNPYSLYY